VKRSIVHVILIWYVHFILLSGKFRPGTLGKWPNTSCYPMNRNQLLQVYYKLHYYDCLSTLHT